MTVEPYLDFSGRCEEALHFYRDAIGAEIVSVMRFSENPDAANMPPMPPEHLSKVMHSLFTVGGSKLMASDGRCTGQASFSGITLTLNADGVPHAEKAFAALAEGGAVQMPLTPTFWAKAFGMVQDRFGVSWMVMAM